MKGRTIVRTAFFDALRQWHIAAATAAVVAKMPLLLWMLLLLFSASARGFLPVAPSSSSCWQIRILSVESCNLARGCRGKSETSD